MSYRSCNRKSETGFCQATSFTDGRVSINSSRHETDKNSTDSLLNKNDDCIGKMKKRAAITLKRKLKKAAVKKRCILSETRFYTKDGYAEKCSVDYCKDI